MRGKIGDVPIGKIDGCHMDVLAVVKGTVEGRADHAGKTEQIVVDDGQVRVAIQVKEFRGEAGKGAHGGAGAGERFEDGLVVQGQAKTLRRDHRYPAV